MSTGCWRIKPSEIERTIKSIRSAGLNVRTVELAPDGTIKVTVDSVGAQNGATEIPETPEQLRKLL